MQYLAITAVISEFRSEEIYLAMKASAGTVK